MIKRFPVGEWVEMKCENIQSERWNGSKPLEDQKCDVFYWNRDLKASLSMDMPCYAVNKKRKIRVFVEYVD